MVRPGIPEGLARTSVFPRMVVVAPKVDGGGHTINRRSAKPDGSTAPSSADGAPPLSPRRAVPSPCYSHMVDGSKKAPKKRVSAAGAVALGGDRVDAMRIVHLPCSDSGK